MGFIGRTYQHRITGKRYRRVGYAVGVVFLKEISEDDKFTGKMHNANMYWLRLMYRQTEHVPLARLLRE